jgi:hypothetical protein
MNLKLGVLSASFLALAGCHVGVGGGYYGPHYYGGGYGYYGGVHSSSYGSSGVVYNAPQPVAQPRAVVASSNPVVGSDGTFGWRSPTPTPDNELRRLNENLVRAQCHIQSTVPNETIAQCGNVIAVVRIDSANAYKLCGQGTDANVCSATWSRIGP